MPSTVWTGAISFGLVSVPVRLVSATRNRDVSFHQLEEGSGARIRYRKVSEATGEEVPAARIVKGYEVAPGRHVIVTADELKTLEPAATRAIEIEEFVDLAEIDPVFFEQPYFVLPEPNGVKPYKLLVEAMSELGRVAVGRVVMRSRESLVALRVRDGFLCLETMRWADELVGADELGGAPGADVELGDRERLMATQLIEALSGPFEAGKHRNEHRESLLALIERKAAGEEIVAAPEGESPAVIVDLMAALEASLRDAGGGTRGRAGRGGTRRGATSGEGSEGTAGSGAAGDDANTDADADERSIPRRRTRSRRSA